jgi:hypothetical protein
MARPSQNVQNSAQSNWEPLSDIITSGTPKSLKILSISAITDEDDKVRNGTQAGHFL